MVWIFGNHAVQMACKNSNREIYDFWCTTEKYHFWQSFAKANGLQCQVRSVDKKNLDSLFPRQVHQGVAIKTSLIDERTLTDCYQDKIIIALDHIKDIRNIGSIARSCAAFGVKAIIVTKTHMPAFQKDYPNIAKAASGALELVDIIEVVNLSRALEQLKQNGFWIIGMDGSGQSLVKYKDHKPIVLVIGQEGSGMRELTKKHCHECASIPTSGAFSCLNASVAAALGLYIIQ